MKRAHRSESVGKGFGQAWDAGEPERTPYLKVRKVACPTCGAGVDESCINQGLRTGSQDKGKPCGNHPSRKRMAARARNRELSP